MTTDDPEFEAIIESQVEGLAPCECCDEGISYTTGTVCVACDGLGWREP